MPSASDVLLTKAAEPPTRPARGRKRDQAAEHLQRRAVRRLELVAWLTLAVQLLVWLAVNLVQGTLAEEFTTALEWGFPFGVAAASLGIALLTRNQRLTPATVVRFGLIYQIVISFGMAAGTYVGAFEHADGVDGLGVELGPPLGENRAGDVCVGHTHVPVDPFRTALRTADWGSPANASLSGASRLGI